MDYKTIQLYRHQTECIEAKKNQRKCLLNLWCGTGKTRIIMYSILDDNQITNVIVFPSLGLINQFNNDYLLNDEFSIYFKNYKCLSVCSESKSKLNDSNGEENFTNIKYTTDKSLIQEFLNTNKKNKKLLVVTYQSLNILVDLIIENKITINRLYYDEAHRIVGDNIQEIVFNNPQFNNLIQKIEYYTATPTNKNGIKMYNDDNPELSDCGPTAYKYLYYQAVEDGISRPFDIKLMLYPKKHIDNNINLFDSIFNECFQGEYNYYNILMFYNKVEEIDGISSVNDVCKNKDKFKESFERIKAEYNNKPNNNQNNSKVNKFKNIKLRGVTSEKNNREKVLKVFDKEKKGRIYCLASCKTLGEGIDTKYANVMVPVDPSGSLEYEQQKIGRITRKPKDDMPNGVILIPVWIDINKYQDLDTEATRDEIIRNELNCEGNFKTFINVISAYQHQSEPGLFDICLKYPNMYSPTEINTNLSEQGYKIINSKGTLIENIEYLSNTDLSSFKNDTIEDDNEEMKDDNIVDNLKIQSICNHIKSDIEIITQSYEYPSINYTCDKIDMLNFDSDSDYGTLSDSSSNSSLQNESNSVELNNNNNNNNDTINNNEINNTNVILNTNKLKIFQNEDNIYSPIISLNKKKRDYSKRISPPKKRKKIFDIHCHDDLKLYLNIDENSINLENKLCHGILNIDVSWNETKWNEKFESLKEFIDKNGKIPSKTSKDKDEKSLGNWMGHQKENFKNQTQIMKNEEIYNIWEQFITSEKYKKYFLSNENEWKQNQKSLKDFIDKNGKTPSSTSKDNDEKTLGQWLGTQTQNFKKKAYIMKNEEIYNIWEQFTTSEKYKKYFMSNEDEWKQTFKSLKDFIDKNDKTPSQKSKDKDEKILGIWLSNQKKNFKKKACIMGTNPEIYDTWEQFTTSEKYKKYFLSNENEWKQNLESLKQFIDKNDKTPSLTSKDEKKLGRWLSNQKKNFKNQTQIMKNEEIYNIWEQFITSEKYKKYFLSNENEWKQNQKSLKDFIDKNGKTPSSTSKDKDEKSLGGWLSNQKKTFKNKTEIMKNEKIYNIWEEFTTSDKYKKYFLSNENEWEQKFESFKEFIDKNGKTPSSTSKDKNEKSLGQWLGTQKENFKNKTHIMKTNPEIYYA